jgi:hypothetical protein
LARADNSGATLAGGLEALGSLLWICFSAVTPVLECGFAPDDLFTIGFCDIDYLAFYSVKIRRSLCAALGFIT